MPVTDPILQLPQNVKVIKQGQQHDCLRIPGSVYGKKKNIYVYATLRR